MNTFTLHLWREWRCHRKSLIGIGLVILSLPLILSIVAPVDEAQPGIVAGFILTIAVGTVGLIVSTEGFEGGATTFYLPESDGGGKLEARGVRPRQGAVLCFPQGNTASLVHEGSTVSKGRKYVIRTDMLFWDS